MRRAVGAVLAILVLIGGLSPPLSAQLLGPIQGITVIDSGTACVTAPTACATFDVGTSASFAFDVSGTWTGTLTFEGTANGGVWRSIQATNPATGAVATTTTASGTFTVGNAGYVQVRARATGAITGTANVSGTRGYARGSGGGFVNGSGVALGPILFPDGTSGAPSHSFPSELTLGFWRSAAATITNQGKLIVSSDFTVNGTSTIANGQTLRWNSNLQLLSPAAGLFNLVAWSGTTGSQFKVDALPVYATGFGATTPAVVAGSTPYAGAINVGTGTISATGTITFGGTAFPSTPYCLCGSTVAAGACSTDGTSTTVLTLTTAVAPVASSVIRWSCPSSK